MTPNELALLRCDLRCPEGPHELGSQTDWCPSCHSFVNAVLMADFIDEEERRAEEWLKTQHCSADRRT